MSLLEGIGGPDDLKKLTLTETVELAADIRRKVIETVSVNGGHLAPNLGTVELTLALHRVFDSPRDRIIWDVGHQAYVHKLVTGRASRFHTIRQLGGISGYCKRSESPHDFFGAGHGSTSISAALGFAVGRDRLGHEGRVIAVIGDGSLTGGMAFEALNHAGHLGTNMMVVLNDNEMSISPNVGALHKAFTRIRTNPRYLRAKARLERLAHRLPFGDELVEFSDKARDAVTTVGTPGLLFQELGFTYLGPIDGHDQALLEEMMRHTMHIDGPVLFHVITVKGKGYQPAEDNSIRFHGVTPFEIETGAARKAGGAPTYSDVFVQALLEIAREDPKVVAISAAMLEGTGLVKFQEEFPDRTYDVGMAEQHAVTFSAGLAAEGVKPVCAIYSTFLQRAFDQVLHDVCIQNLPVTLMLDRAGIVGEDGPTHNGVFDLAYLRCIPNLVVMAPADSEELRRMLATAIAYPGPAAVRFPRATAEGALSGLPPEPYQVGKGVRLRDGSDVALVALGSMVLPSLRAAELLAAEGIEATVVNARFVKPLDMDLLATVAADVPHIVTIEEGCLMGGFGSAVMEAFESHDMHDVRIHRMGLPDRFVEHGPRTTLLDMHGLSAEGIVARVRQILRRTPSVEATVPAAA